MISFWIFASFFAGISAQLITGEGPCGSSDHDILLPDPTSCNYFYQCVHGTSVRMSCPADLHFSPASNRCERPSIAGCISGNTTTTPGGGGVTTPPPPPVQKPCTGLEAETIGYPDDCKQYINCHMGVPEIVKCAVKEYYSQDHNACIETSECPATATTASPPITTPTKPTAPTPPTNTTTASPNPIIPPCTSHDPEFLPSVDDCARYIYCCVGIPVPMRCKDGEYFSEKEKMCIKSGECPQGTTTTTPTPTPTTPTTTTSPPFVPPCQSFGRETYPVSSNCRRYIYCVFGKPFVVKCVTGKFYSEKDTRCIKADKCPQ